MKRFAFLFIVILTILLITSSCARENGNHLEKNHMDKQLIGTWRHQDVPLLPHYNTWIIIFNEDGTYKTESDTYETADSGIKSFTESFGEKGTYVLSENKILFRSNADQSRTEIYEILESNGQTQLVFKDSNGNNKSSIGVNGVIYDLLFIKEK